MYIGLTAPNLAFLLVWKDVNSIWMTNMKLMDVLDSYECNDYDDDSFEDGEICNDDDDTADLGPQWAAITQRRLLPPATPSHICTVSTTLISKQMMRMMVNDEVWQVFPKNYTGDDVWQFVWFISVRLKSKSHPWLARRWWGWWRWLWRMKKYIFVPQILQGMFDNWSRGDDASTWSVSTRSRICSLSTRLIRNKYNVSMIYSKLPGLWTWTK